MDSPHKERAEVQASSSAVGMFQYSTEMSYFCQGCVFGSGTTPEVVEVAVVVIIVTVVEVPVVVVVVVVATAEVVEVALESVVSLYFAPSLELIIIQLY